MTASTVSIPYSKENTCLVCMLNPFEEDQTISSHKWYGHSVICEAGTTAENKVIHGICAKCFAEAPRTPQILQCYECREPFPDRRISEINVQRDGTLISETLLPPIIIENEAVTAVRIRPGRVQNFEDVILTSPCFYFGMAGASAVACIGALFIASSATTTYLVPGAHLAVRVTQLTPSTLGAVIAVPVFQALCVGCVALGVLASINEGVKACSRFVAVRRH